MRSPVRYEAKESESMGFFNGSARDELTKTARPGLLQLMGSHSPGHGEPAALLEVVDAYLRLNPHDDEVREGRERLVRTAKRVGT